jgi:hypothetical protein
MHGMKVEISSLVLVGVLALTPGIAGAADAVSSFKDWTVVCDNLRACQVAGFGPEDSDLSAVLRLGRDSAPGAPAKVELDLQEGEAGLEGKALTLAIDGRGAMTTQPASPRAEGGFTLVLDDAQVGPLLGAARNGTLLSVQIGDKVLGQVSLAGMVAALRYVDDQQKRAGTVTAMVAKGPAPAASVPRPPPVPVLHAAPAIAQTGLPSRPPAAVLALVGKAECDVAPDRGDPPEVSRLSADKVLWQVACWSGAYNFSSLFVIVDKAGRATPAPLEGLSGTDAGVAVNAGYDPKSRTLASYGKGRGIGECGDSTQWVWTGAVFARSGATTMPVCRGYSLEWPTVFRSEIR